MTKKAAQQGDNSNEAIESFSERVLRLLEEKDQISEAVSEIYAEAKGNGFNVKALRRAVAIQRKDQEKWRQEEADLEIYLHVLGLL
jgi:uncharacterized protein (UPF0335 family)